ncbi:MAG: aldehyde dehydrogenase family protein, partial [Planifilum fulgidum]
MNCRTCNYINGKWVPSRNGKTLASINPARSHEIVGEVPDSDREDLNEAVSAARNAFAMWSGLSPVERGAYLQKAAEILEERLEDIAVTATREMGKILPETKGEVLRGAAILRY